LKSLHVLGDEYVDILKEAYENRWVDVYENKGKRSGAYSSGAYGTNPYILMNWHDNVNNLLDLYKNTRSEGFGDEVKRRIMLGTFALSSGYYDAYYKKAQQVRTLIKNDFENVFANYDVIIGPTTPTPAFKVGEKVDDPMTMYANDILTIPVNLAGVPAISVPCGFGANNMPLGLQIIGKHFDEATIYRVAHAFEQATDYHTKKASL
ncbi:amidase family protein, partial [Vibrio parahaemolyticus]|nr:amidase family protein [Vibrio parahaemolyticus]